MHSSWTFTSNMNCWRIVRVCLAVACVVLVAAACGRGRSTSPSGRAAEPAPPGRLIDIGGYRLHLHCSGRGSPTVVLVSGSGDFSFDWALVQPQLARTTRVCSYDRAGSAWSDLGPSPRTMRQEVFELHRLLERAGERSPLVLVGHSYGGLLARLYTESHPGRVGGIVMVDPTHEDTQLMMQGRVARVREAAQPRVIPPVQTMQSSPPRAPTEEDLAQHALNRQVFGPPEIKPPYHQLPVAAQAYRLWALNHPKLSASGDSYWAEELQQIHESRTANPRPLGAVPLIVVAGGVTGSAPQGLDEGFWRQLNNEKRAQKADLATLSTHGKLIVDEKSGHHVHLDNPRLVIEAVHEVIAAVRETSRAAR